MYFFEPRVVFYLRLYYNVDMFKQPPIDQNFIEMEKKWLKHWYETYIVKKYLSKNMSSKEYFSFLDGPITANNPMGVHHAWGRTYKDVWQKFHNLLGYRQRFQNGFDCQGLWVEVEVEKELGLKSKKDIEELVPGNKMASIAKFVQLCKDRVLKYSAIQTDQTKRLGNFMDWDNSYFTMSDENNYMIWHLLKKCYENGWVYKGHDSVPWCPRCETAISQHEMLTEDYKEVVHDSIFISFPVVDKKNEYFLVWTTTPWTIPANIAVAVEKEHNYSLVETESGDKYWLVQERIESIFKGSHKVLKTVKGSKLVGLHYKAPFDDLETVQKAEKENPSLFHSVIATDDQIMPILTTEGTGIVHTAVSAGTEDFKLGKKLGLPMIPVIEDNANYLPTMGFLAGKNAKKHPELIFDYLKERQSSKGEKWIFEIMRYKHRYPACWRCKTELVWKVADEWYIAMDKPKKSGKTLREMMAVSAKKMAWMPDFGLDRELDWLKNMHDWLISKKNRYWGLALPIFVCSKCGTFEVLGSKDELKARAIKGWETFEGHTPHKPFVDEVIIACSRCQSDAKRIQDVGNPWLDAGIVPYSTITKNNQGEPLYLKNKEEWKKWAPVDFITESFPGQFKNWFYALIAESTVLEEMNPTKRILGFGTLLGEDGRAMHKSWGNSIEFNEGADKMGVDVIRWMFARQNPSENMLFGYKKADEVRRKFYLILWNTYKYFLEYGNLENFDPKKGNFNNEQLINILDSWIISRFASTVKLVEISMKGFSAKDAAFGVEEFVSDLSTWYIRRSRERLWVNSDNKQDKEHFYSTIYFILLNLSIVLSPFMPYISEEIYTNLTGKESVHLETWPKMMKTSIDEQLEKEMKLARKATEEGHAKRKQNNLKVKIPVGNLEWKSEQDYTQVRPAIWEIVLKELNVKNITINSNLKFPKTPVKYTDAELRHEGEVRELIREIQSERKKLNCQINDKIILTIPETFKKDCDYIKTKVIAKEIKIGDKVEISLA